MFRTFTFDSALKFTAAVGVFTWAYFYVCKVFANCKQCLKCLHPLASLDLKDLREDALEAWDFTSEAGAAGLLFCFWT